MIFATQALDIVRQRINEIKDAQLRWKAVEADPASTTKQRAEAKALLQRREMEFSWQWQNVERILQECLREGL